ncbi:MAG: hypothetical protein J7513_15615 [Solirubrobacteraceae bacterium]|nr:hypothetical protein [Solirubrobacteraceae bacterium]
MLAVVFLSVWIGLAAAMTGPGRRWVLGPLVVVVAMACAGALAAIWWAIWLTPLGAIALGLHAGWTESPRSNAVALAVVAVNVVAYAFLGLGDYDPPTLDGGTKFALIAFGLYAIPALIGRGLRDVDRWTQRRVASGAQEVSVVRRVLRPDDGDPEPPRPHVRVTPPPPRDG